GPEEAGGRAQRRGGEAVDRAVREGEGAADRRRAAVHVKHLGPHDPRPTAGEADPRPTIGRDRPAGDGHPGRPEPGLVRAEDAIEPRSPGDGNEMIPLPVSNGSAPPLVTIRELRVELGGQPVLNGVNADLLRGKVTALIGLNGSGRPRCCGRWCGSTRSRARSASTAGTTTRSRPPSTSGTSRRSSPSKRACR